MVPDVRKKSDEQCRVPVSPTTGTPGNFRQHSNAMSRNGHKGGFYASSHVPEALAGTAASKGFAMQDQGEVANTPLRIGFRVLMQAPRHIGGWQGSPEHSALRGLPLGVYCQVLQSGLVFHKRRGLPHGETDD